jgi:hypothetical protein
MGSTMTIKTRTNLNSPAAIAVHPAGGRIALARLRRAGYRSPA